MSKVDYRRQTKSIYTWAAGAYASLAVLAAVLMSSASYQLTVGHLAQDDLASKKSAAIVPGAHVLFDVPLKWAVVATLLLSAIVPLLFVTRWQAQYKKAIRKRVMPWRWIDLGVTTALMIEIIAILSGMQDIVVLKVLAGLMVVTCLLGWLAERAAIEAKKLVRPIFGLSLVTGSLPWVVILTYAVLTPVYAAIRAPWYLYALYLSSFASFTLLAYNQWRQHQRVGDWKDYVFIERNYAAINVAAKILFALILIVGLKK